MKILGWLERLFVESKRSYRLELPIGLELSDGDRAAIYGWPDKYTDEVQGKV